MPLIPIIVGVAVIVLVVLFTMMWRVAEPNEALIISGLKTIKEVPTGTASIHESLGFRPRLTK